MGGQSTPVERETLLPQERDSFTRNLPGSLPSRSAENLTWLGRYIERSEDAVRILRAYHVRLAETSDPDMPLLADVSDYLEPFGIDPKIAIPPGLIRRWTAPSTAPGRSATGFRPTAGWR